MWHCMTVCARPPDSSRGFSIDAVHITTRVPARCQRSRCIASRPVTRSFPGGGAHLSLSSPPRSRNQSPRITADRAPSHSICGAASAGRRHLRASEGRTTLVQAGPTAPFSPLDICGSVLGAVECCASAQPTPEACSAAVARLSDSKPAAAVRHAITTRLTTLSQWRPGMSLGARARWQGRCGSSRQRRGIARAATRVRTGSCHEESPWFAPPPPLLPQPPHARHQPAGPAARGGQLHC